MYQNSNLMSKEKQYLLIMKNKQDEIRKAEKSNNRWKS
jgi:hypothetical protein